MKLWKLPDQVLRIGILFVLVLVGFIVARQRLVPDSFGELGHYRADAVTDVAALPTHYAGAELCAECHDDMAETIAASYHRGLSCEVCHGPGAAHADDPSEARPIVPDGRDRCLYCHEYLPSRPTGFPQVEEKTHNPPEPCMTCHEPHDPTPPHVPETCTGCHGQIARTKAFSPHRALGCETCHEATPQHSVSPRNALPTKPTQRSFCGQCHAPDAESPAHIPRVDIATHEGRYLCWQCHYPHFPEAR